MSPADRQLYREAFNAARSGDWAKAARKAGQAHDPILGKAFHFLDLERPNGGARFAEITSFLAANPNWPGETILRQRAEEASSGVADAELIDWFKRYPPLTAAGKLRQADIRLAQGENDSAATEIRQVWIDADFNAYDERNFLQKYGGFLRPEDQDQRLDRLLWDGRDEIARRQMTRVDNSRRATADARMALARLASNADRLVQLVPADMQNDPGLLYERVRWHRRREAYEGAIAILDNALSELMRPQAWWTERELLARHALQTGDAALAYRLASRHGMASGANYADAEFLSGWIALRFLHQPHAAYIHFLHLYSEVTRPVSLTRGAYWAGRAASEMGYKELALTWYSTAADFLTAYYGQLAASEIGTDGKLVNLEEPRPQPKDISAFEALELVRVARALGEADAADFAKQFVIRLSDLATSPAEHALVAQLADQIARPDLAVSAARRASYAGVTLLAKGYPVADMPPGGHTERPLILAMTRQESGFDKGAISRVGARGMMQLMPATAKTTAKALKIPYSQQRLLTDSRYNITLGRAYLEGLLDRFGGSYVLSVAAYNAGPARVNQWVRDLGDPRMNGADAIDWVESIPFGETRNYVQRVMENLQVYRLRLGDRALAFSLPADLRR